MSDPSVHTVHMFDPSIHTVYVSYPIIHTVHMSDPSVHTVHMSYKNCTDVGLWQTFTLVHTVHIFYLIIHTALHKHRPLYTKDTLFKHTLKPVYILHMFEPCIFTDLHTFWPWYIVSNWGGQGGHSTMEDIPPYGGQCSLDLVPPRRIFSRCVGYLAAYNSLIDGVFLLVLC